MLLLPGKGISPRTGPKFTSYMNLVTALPRDLTYTRNDSAATWRGSDGKLRVVSGLNEPRFDHTAAGKPLGLKIHEESRTNKCTNFNINPTGTTNMTVTGGTLELVDDSTELANAGLDKICTNGKVYKATGVGATAVVTFTGQFGNTNAHSYSIWARGEGTSTTGQLRRSGSGSPLLSINSGTGYQRYTIENDTPSSTSNELRITAFDGESTYFILNQAEEGTTVTTEIVTQGASATREDDELYLDDPNSKSYFDEARGFMTVHFRTAEKTRSATVYPIIAHDNSTNNTIGLRLGPENEIRGSVKAAAASKHLVQNQDEVPVDAARLYLHSAGVAWKPGEAFIASSGMKNLQTYTGDPSGITRINIGSRNANADPLVGYIMGVTISKKYPSDIQMGQALSRHFDKTIGYSGQSIAVGRFISQGTGLGDGRINMVEKWADAQPSLDIHVFNGATGGAALLQASENAAGNYYVHQDTGLFDGDAYAALETSMALAGNKCDLFIWSQGEQDSHHLGAAEPTKATYKTHLKSLLDQVRSITGNPPVLIDPIGRRTGTFSNTGGVQLVREAQSETITENAYIHRGPEKFDQALFDDVHPADAAYAVLGQRDGRKGLDLLGFTQAGVDGPSITGAVRSGTTVTVTISHDGGADFTPTTGIEGFHFFDDATEINITAAVRTNATTITLTLASTPAGTETLYYFYDAELTINTANIVMDNATPAMALRSTKVTL